MEDYKKKYEEIIRNIKEAKERMGGYTFSSVVDKIIPELKESEDERIRKHLIKHFGNKSKEDWNGVPVKSILAWLENEQKSTDKVEHKFNVGDEIKTSKEESLTITKIDEKGYWSEDLFICDFDEECVWDLVEQKSAWSEEDETGLGDAMWAIEQARTIAKDENDMGNLWYAEKWLNSIKERMKGE